MTARVGRGHIYSKIHKEAERDRGEGGQMAAQSAAGTDGCHDGGVKSFPTILPPALSPLLCSRSSRSPPFRQLVAENESANLRLR